MRKPVQNQRSGPEQGEAGLKRPRETRQKKQPGRRKYLGTQLQVSNTIRRMGKWWDHVAYQMEKHPLVTLTV